jgi:acyl-coenzyme A thioesterase PaaI-like protein
MSEDAARYLRASLAAPPFHQWLRPELRDLDSESGRVTIALPLRAEFRRDPKRREIHGGVIAALDYLRAAAGDELLAIAEPVKLGRSLGTVDIRVTDDQGKLVAIGRGIFSTREG